jgi:hypothetical protein
MVRRDAPYEEAMFGSLLSPASEIATGCRYTLWIDGVGAWQLLTSPVVTLGRATAPVSPLLVGNSLAKDGSDEADVAIMSSISRKHAQLERVNESWVLTAHSAMDVEGRSVDGQAVLPDDCELTLGGSVQLGFCVTTPLSTSARLSFLSEHRPTGTVDGVVLMAQTVLLGPGPENHVRCPQWPASVVLVRNRSGLAVKSRKDIFVDGSLVTGLTRLSSGQVVSGTDFRFRLEEINPKR